MKTLEKGQDKIKRICDELRRETLEPAQHEAQRIIQAAEAEAERIVAEANKEADRVMQQAKRAMEQERNVLQSSLSQACKQSVEALRQDIEQRLFSDELGSLVQGGTSGPMLVAKLVTSIVQAIEKEGVSADLTALVPQSVPPQEVNQALGENIRKRLRDHGVQVGRFHGGAQIRLNDKKMTIDISDMALKDLLASYVRKDFRNLIFGQ